MVNKTIGAILIIAGGALMMALLARGGPIFPHFIGPVTLAALGVIVLARGAKAP